MDDRGNACLPIPQGSETECLQLLLRMHADASRAMPDELSPNQRGLCDDSRRRTRGRRRGGSRHLRFLLGLMRRCFYVSLVLFVIVEIRRTNDNFQNGCTSNSGCRSWVRSDHNSYTTRRRLADVGSNPSTKVMFRKGDNPSR